MIRWARIKGGVGFPTNREEGHQTIVPKLWRAAWRQESHLLCIFQCVYEGLHQCPSPFGMNPKIAPINTLLVKWRKGLRNLLNLWDDLQEPGFSNGQVVPPRTCPEWLNACTDTRTETNSERKHKIFVLFCFKPLEKFRLFRSSQPTLFPVSLFRVCQGPNPIAELFL